MTKITWEYALESLMEGFAQACDPDEILETLMSMVRQASGARAVFAFLSGIGSQWLCEAVDEESPQNSMGGTLASRALGMPFDQLDQSSLSALRAGQTITRKVGASNGPQDSSQAALSSQTWQETLGVSGLVLLVPLLFGPRLDGCLALWHETEEPFTEEDKTHAAQMCSHAVIAMQMLEHAGTRQGDALLYERERIARDLHDLAIQGLFASGMKLERLKDRLHASGLSKADRSQLEEEVARTLALLDGSVRQIRGIVYGLRGEDQTQGLADKLRHEASTSLGNLGFAPTFVIEVDGADDLEDAIDLHVNDELSGDVVAVVREALSNAARHAHATSVHVSVEVFGTGPSGEVIVEVIDDGTGLDPARTRNSGLANMQHRAVLRGGNFTVGSGPRGRGTALVWRAPLA